MEFNLSSAEGAVPVEVAASPPAVSSEFELAFFLRLRFRLRLEDGSSSCASSSSFVCSGSSVGSSVGAFVISISSSDIVFVKVGGGVGLMSL